MNKLQLESIKILVVEDEVLIGDMISRHLSRKGYQIVGVALSVKEAISMWTSFSPHLLLVDIRLKGEKTGIDLARMVRRQDQEVPIIYLTSQIDQHTIQLAKQTFPSGYLSKPVRTAELYAAVEIALFKKNHVQEERIPTITLQYGRKTMNVSTSDILFLEANHVYTNIYLVDGEKIVQRTAISELSEKLPKNLFVRTHRAYIINKSRIKSFSPQGVELHGAHQTIPIARSKRSEILAKLAN